MSEETAASDPLSRRSAVSLPPRKRLLAGFKHTFWSLPLSHPAVLQVKPEFDESSGEGLVKNHVEGKILEDEQVEESMFSYNRKHRKSGCESITSITRFKVTRNVRNDIRVSSAADDLETDHHSEKESLKIDDDSGKHYCRHDQRRVSTDETENLGNIKRRENHISYFDMIKPRRNPSRQNYVRAKDLFDRIDKTTHVRLSRSDEELALELHRAMNSSPRILNHRNLKLGSSSH